MASADVASQVQALVAEGRLPEAAQLAASSGMPAQASVLFERACDFTRAAQMAIEAGDVQRAVVLSVLSGDRGHIDTAVELAVSGDAERARGAAAAARARGHARIAGMILERVGDAREAAEAYTQAGEATLAAALFVRAGDARAAARVLEAALRADPDNQEASLRLGELLVHHGKYDAAMRALQRIGESSPSRREALPLLIACAQSLGLAEPAQVYAEEAQRSGAAVEVAPSAATGVQQPSVVYGRYEIVRAVASTHAARVFEAIDRLTGGRVAVKQLVAANVLGGGRDAFERLVREARVLERLRHPNVVPLVELIADGGAVVTPWMSGGSLADVLSRGRVVPARAAEITSAVLAALGEAHGLGILHRDVKPSNILFDDAGVPRLADFGAAHISDSSATATAGVIGTLAYMSPEQRVGRPATTASDLYSAGATLYEMLVGEPPPTHATPLVLPSQANPELTTKHDAIVMALIAQAPSDRPADAWAARASLAALRWPVEPCGTSAPRMPAPAVPVRGARYQQGADGRVVDTWLGRRVLLVEASPPMVSIAKAAATLSHDGLPSVLRIDAEAGLVCWEFPAGQTLREANRRLTQQERTTIAEALQALHASGLAHGAVDADHVVLRHGGAQLAWEPGLINGARPEADQQALLLLS